MKAQILTLFTGSSTETVCKNIALAVDNLEGRFFIETIDHPYGDYCAVITDKKINKDEAALIYQALDLTRQYERDKEYLQEEEIERIDVIYDEILNLIKKDKLHKLAKSIDWIKELMYSRI